MDTQASGMRKSFLRSRNERTFIRRRWKSASKEVCFAEFIIDGHVFFRLFFTISNSAMASLDRAQLRQRGIGIYKQVSERPSLSSSSNYQLELTRRSFPPRSACPFSFFGWLQTSEPSLVTLSTPLKLTFFFSLALSPDPSYQFALRVRTSFRSELSPPLPRRLATPLTPPLPPLVKLEQRTRILKI